jgi:hypothetical protein
MTTHGIFFRACQLSLLVAASMQAGEPGNPPRKIGDELWRQGNGPLSDSDIEHLARGVAYTGGATAKEIQNDPKLAAHLEKNGMKLLDSIGGKTDMQAMLMKDTRTNQVYVVFRGSEFDKLSKGDALTDMQALTKSGVGASQYWENSKKLKEWAVGHAGNITVTGHSLGGALGQRFIADNPGAVKNAVLFNAPGIDQYHAEKTAGTNLPSITYYRNKNDVVDHTGHHLRGQVYTVGGGTTSSLNPGSVLVAEHRGAMLQGDKGVKIEKTSFDEWQRGMFGQSMTKKEADFRIALQEKSDALLQGMSRLENALDQALRARDYTHTRELLNEYKGLKSNLGALTKEASVTLPANPDNPLLPDKQVLDIQGRHKEIAQTGVVAFAEKSTQERAAEKPAEKSKTTTDKIAQDLTSGLTPADNAIAKALKPRPKPPKKIEKKGPETDLAELEDEGEKELEAQRTAELTRALEAEGLTELQAAAYAQHDAEMKAAQNMDELLAAITAALQDSGDWDYGGGSTSSPRNPGTPRNPQPAKNSGNKGGKGVCTKPCPPKKKK